MPPSFSATQCLNFPDRCNRTAITRGVIPLFDQRPWGANLGSERSLMSRFSYHSVDEKSKHQFTVCPGVLLSKKHCSNPLESSKCFATSGNSQVELWRLNASVLAGVYRHEFPLFTCPGTVLFLVTPLVGQEYLALSNLSRSSRVESSRVLTVSRQISGNIWWLHILQHFTGNILLMSPHYEGDDNSERGNLAWCRQDISPGLQNTWTFCQSHCNHCMEASSQNYPPNPPMYCYNCYNCPPEILNMTRLLWKRQGWQQPCSTDPIQVAKTRGQPPMHPKKGSKSPWKHSQKG